jgi:hypothetical protein
MTNSTASRRVCGCGACVESLHTLKIIIKIIIKKIISGNFLFLKTFIEAVFTCVVLDISFCWYNGTVFK